MRRREFISLLGGATAWPLPTRAQKLRRMRRLGVLMAVPEHGSDSQARVAALEDELQQLGWKTGQNLQVEYRWGMFEANQARVASTDLIKWAPDVILADGTAALDAARRVTKTIPIVFVVVSEPVAQGFVTSLAHPGGDITGFSNLEPSVGAKWIELLQEVAPHVTRVGIVFNPEATPIAVSLVRAAEAAAKRSGIVPITLDVHEPADIEEALKNVAERPDGGLIFPVDTFTTAHRKLVIDLASRYRLPAVYGFPYFAEDGGLMSYGINVIAQFVQAARYIDLIFRGNKPADLPVQEPTKFELVINLKTAKALSLSVSPTLLALADEVIE